MSNTINTNEEAATRVAKEECAQTPREIRAAEMGQEWAEDTANADELERLARRRRTLDPVDQEISFEELPGQAYSTATRIVEIMIDHLPDRELARECWEAWLALEPYEAVVPVELQAFVMAACEVWESENPILSSKIKKVEGRRPIKAPARCRQQAKMGKNRKIEDPKFVAKAEEIWELHRACKDFTQRSEEAAMEAAANAWEAGRRLQEVKESMRHGDWMPWLQNALPQISQATVYRYRKIAEFFETREEVAKALEEHGCLKGLYRAAGAIGSEAESKKTEAADESPETDSEPTEPDPIVRLQRTLHRLHKVEQEVLKLAGSISPSTWTSNEKAQLLSTTKALLRVVNDNGWWDEISVGDGSFSGKEVPDAA